MTIASDKPKLFTLDLLAPHQTYKNAGGKRLPGVTTILGLLAKPALINWANRQGLAGIDTTKFVQRAADIGTATHARIEASLRGMELDESNLTPELVEKSVNGWVRFDDWWKAQDLVVVETEKRMVSERWQIGGTLDIVAVRPSGALVLVDIKTSTGIYREMRLQVAGAYAPMYEEVTGQPLAEVWIVRIGKEEQDVIEPVQILNREACEHAFDALVGAYKALLPIK